jgi:outer membrane beta-barrel protein
LIRTWLVTAALLGAATASAQGLGLDLSNPDQPTQDSQQAPPPKDDTAPPASSAPNADQLLSSDSGAKSDEKPSLGEDEIIQQDRVKSVQRKVFLKKHRFELEPMVMVSVNDPYYTKFGEAIRGGYYFADTLALAVRWSHYSVYPTDDVRLAKRNFQSRIFYSVPQWSAMADVEWSPLYGKATIFNSILHFDAYVLGGAGIVHAETSAVNGQYPAVDLGVGIRFMVKDYFSVNGSLLNTTYVDQPTGTTQGATQNVMTLNAGISVFFPFHSTGRDSE